MTARLGKDPSRIYTDVTSDLGISFYERIDAPASSAQKSVFKNLSPERVAAKELAGEAIEAKLTKAPGNDRSIGGIKVVAKSGWFAARPSGTEDIYKIYAESFRSKDHLQQIQRDAQTIIDNLVASSRAGPVRAAGASSASRHWRQPPRGLRHRLRGSSRCRRGHRDSSPSSHATGPPLCPRCRRGN
jgi:hypothetical protein